MPLSLHTMMDGNTEEPGGTYRNNGKVRVGAVSYLNTKPLIYGFTKGMMKDELELVIDHPANVAQSLLKGSIDVGLIPVAIIPMLPVHHIMSDYCIAADGEVASVCLFSDMPLEKIKKVVLDYQSRTSVLLAKYLFENYWKLAPEFEEADDDFIQKIEGTTAAVVIGDRAFLQRKISPYCYDLSLAWKTHTGLPFVFAAWVSNKPLPQVFKDHFNAAIKFGFLHLDDVVKENPYPAFDLNAYYTRYIQYRLDEEKLKGLNLFLDWCKSYYAI